MNFKTFKMGLLISVVGFSSAFAAPAAIARKHQVRIQSFRGMTYLQAMVDTREGIKKQLDADYLQVYPMASWESVETHLENFDNKNVRKILSSFENGKDGLKMLVDSLQGQEVSPVEMVNLLKGKLKSGGDIFAVAQFLAMASGAGTLVILDEENYFYNYGYKSGSNPSEDVKSGRSFGAGPLHSAIDASDVFYLNELEKYLQETQDPKPFFKALLKVLLQCDPSGLHELSPLGQTVATDFIAIYTAEVDRHLMVDLDPNRHPWENDLAGSTFVSAFGTVVGKIMKAGTLQEGKTREWWAMSSSGSGRSGIGITRSDRKKLQQLLSGYVRGNDPKSIDSIEAVVGKRKDGDIFQSFLEFINSMKNQTAVLEHGDLLIENLVEILVEIRNDADSIENHVLQMQ